MKGVLLPATTELSYAKMFMNGLAEMMAVLDSLPLMSLGIGLCTGTSGSLGRVHPPIRS
jgi:hypothetical protein